MHKSQLITIKKTVKKTNNTSQFVFCPPLKSNNNKTPYLHLMYSGHFLCNQQAYLRIGHFFGQQWPRIDVLLDTTAGEQAKEFWPQTTFRE